MFNSTIWDGYYHCDDCRPPDSMCFYRAVWKMGEQSALALQLCLNYYSWPGKPLLYSLLCLAEKVSGGFSPSWPIWGPKVWFRKYLITFKNPGLNPAFWETFIRYIFAKDPASQELSECRNATELALKSEGGKYICLWSGSRQWLFHSSGGTGGGEARAL